MPRESSTPPAGEPALPRVVRLAARFYSCPIAVISMVDGERVHFKARYGTACESVARDGWFCPPAISVDEPLVIADAAGDPRFAAIAPLEDAGAIRFYAGVPLAVQGRAVAILAVMDTQPRAALASPELEALRDFAALAANGLEHRGSAGDSPGGVAAPLDGIAGALPAMVWVTDTAGNCTLLNEFEWDKDTVGRAIDRDWLQIIQPEEHEFESKANVTFECRVPGPDGEERWILEQARPRFHGDGSFAGYIGLCLDITDRKRAEEALRETQEWLSLAQSAAGIGFWNWDMLTNAGTCSDYYFRLYGLEPRSSFGYSDWSDHVHPDDRMSSAEWQKRYAAGTDSFQREFRCVWPDGSIHWLYSRAKIFRDETGRPVRALGANIDISSFKKAEERRNQAEKELLASREQLRQLTAHVECAREQERIRISREIHDELGQILTVLKMDLEAVDSRYRTSAPLPLGDITSRIASMLKNLDCMIGTVRRIASELRPGILDHLGLAAAIEWQLQDLESRTGIRCRAVGLPEQLPLDAQQSTGVFRIFQEMLTNVVRHAAASSVKVLVQVEAARLTLQVRDDGKGFDPFRLADPEALGLLGMRERALLLGGSVEVQSQPGKGTTVTLRMPLSARAVK